MICILGKRPVLLIGSQQIAGYDTDWIRSAIEKASIAAEREDFPFLDEIHRWIVFYLEEKCALKLLPIEDLFGRIEHMLAKIGCAPIARALKPSAPPLTISLLSTAREAHGCFELGFFSALKKTLAEMKNYGVQHMSFTDIRESVLQIRHAKKWNKSCEALEKDILAFLQKNSDLTLSAHRSTPLPA